MRVLWIGDAVASTGFARCTHAVCDELHNQGHDVHVLGINYFGDPHRYPYRVYPCVQPFDGGADAFGVGRAPLFIERLNPDVVVLLNDPWNVPEYVNAIRGFGLRNEPPIVGWVAADGKNQRGDGLNGLAHVATWTQWAADELKHGGYKGESTVVPLGVDLSTFKPHDRANARQQLGISAVVPEDALIVGVVGRNQLRKRLDLTIEYFAEFVRDFSATNAYLMLHVAPTGDSGVNLRSLVNYYGLQNRVITSEPDIGHGVNAAQLALIYSAMDVYFTTTQGEGWGLPCLEAMACGVPCIVPRWSGLGDWATAAYKVPCTATAVTAPMNSEAYTIGGIMDKKQAIWALNLMRNDARSRERHSKMGLELAASLPWSRTAAEFCTMLDRVVAAKEVAVG